MIKKMIKNLENMALNKIGLPHKRILSDVQMSYSEENISDPERWGISWCGLEIKAKNIADIRLLKVCDLYKNLDKAQENYSDLEYYCGNYLINHYISYLFEYEKQTLVSCSRGGKY